MHVKNATSKSIKCDIFQFNARQSNIRLIQSNIRLKFDSWFKRVRHILQVPNWIHNYVKLCLLEWELTPLLRSAILFGKKMRRLNQISRTYSFESTKITIWFGACKMRRLNRALILFSTFFENVHNFNNSRFLEVWYVFGDKSIKYHKSILHAIKLLGAQEYFN